MKRLAVAVAGLWLLACSSPTPVSGPIEVELSDFSITTAEVIESGDVVMDLFNAGDLPHTLVVARNDGEVVYASDVLDPGDRVDVDLELTAGTYQLTCRIVVQLQDGTLIDHYQSGMGEPLEVAG